MRSTLLIAVAAMAGFFGGQIGTPTSMAAPPGPEHYTLGRLGQFDGLWVGTGHESPHAAFYADQKNKTVSLIVGRCPGGSPPPFAIAADKDEVFFQLPSGKRVNVQRLEKLAE